MQQPKAKNVFLATAAILLGACSNIPHDNDRLYLHGFIATAGSTVLDDIQQASESDPSKNELLQASVQLKHGNDIISEQAIILDQQWPKAYKLEFTPPQVSELSQDLNIEFILQKERQIDRLYQQTVTLDEPLLFATHKDVIITAHSANESNAKQESQDNNQEKSSDLYERFECSDKQSLKALVNDHYMIIAEPLLILPRTATLPEPIYSSASSHVSFNKDKKFTITIDQNEMLCDLNEDSFAAWESSQQKLKTIMDAKES